MRQRALDGLEWPLERLGEAVEELARRSGLGRPARVTPVPTESIGRGSNDGLSRWVEAAAAALEIQAEPVETTYSELSDLVRGCGPAVLRVGSAGSEGPTPPITPSFLAILGAGRRGIRVLGTALDERRVPSGVVVQALCGPLEVPLEAEIQRLLDDAGIPKKRQPKARAALLRERLGPRRLGGCWLLRLPAGSSFVAQLGQARLGSRLAAVVAAHLALGFLALGSWWMIGRAALQGRLEWGWLAAWALLLLTFVPLQLLAAWWQAQLAIGAGGLLKRRLLHGALGFDSEALRREGSGQLLGRVIESQAVESMALSGGFLALVAGVELTLATVVLAVGAGGWLHAVLLVGWITLQVMLAVRYLRRRSEWTEGRLQMTHELVERMVGHRTRLAQEARERWHEGEDQALGSYAQRSAEMDSSAALLLAFAPRGWLVLGFIGLVPALAGAAASPGALAVSLGGVLLARQSLAELADSLVALCDAAIAWRKVAPLFRAARPPGDGAQALQAMATSAAPASPGSVLLDAADLGFRYRPQGDRVLKGVSLRIHAGDRVLLEGPSGGGKSTLASLLTGLREPESGLLLLDGLDLATLGLDGWRRRVTSAPQFHENHVLTETFAFNALMARRWPPEQSNLDEAEALCRTLGLGELLERMPAGLMQTVGETGWQLSHGERSRLYIARALLQNAELVVLDESFAALDPENLERALRCVLDKARTLLVIAHP